MTPPTIDRSVFEELKATTGSEFALELLDTFLEEAPAMLDELHQALAVQDADRFRRAAHSLKSNSLTFGALALGAMARDLELGGLAAAQGLEALDALTLEYVRVDAALKALCHG